MKMRIFAATVAFGALASAIAGPEQAVKERALRLQNPPPQQAPAPAQPASTTTRSTQSAVPVLTAEQQQCAEKLQADLGILKAGSQVTPEQKSKFAEDLAAAAQGASKPSTESLQKLAADLQSTLAGKTIYPAERTRLATDLVAVLNSAGITEQQAQKLAADAQSILTSSGVSKADAATVAQDLKAIGSELRKSTAK